MCASPLNQRKRTAHTGIADTVTWGEKGNEKAADSFRFPRVIRNRALRRWGYDFDDHASHPRAALRCVGVQYKKSGRRENRSHSETTMIRTMLITDAFKAVLLAIGRQPNGLTANGPAP